MTNVFVQPNGLCQLAYTLSWRKKRIHSSLYVLKSRQKPTHKKIKNRLDIIYRTY